MRLAGLLFPLFLAGCGATEVHSVVLRQVEPREGRRVEIFPEGQGRWPNRPFLEVALVQGLGSGARSDAADVVDAMRDRAADLGCDALVRLRIDQGATITHGYGVCIRYSGPPSAIPGRPPPPASLQFQRPATPTAPAAEPDGTVHL